MICLTATQLIIIVVLALIGGGISWHYISGRGEK